jgi:hypothetical protein
MFHPEGKEGSRRDPSRITLKEMATARKIPEPDLFAEKLEAWGVKAADWHAKDVKNRLAKTKLPLADQLVLFSTAEHIAEAEKAKHSWNLKVKAPRYTAVSKIATSAARLSREISEMFPPPWADERARMGVLVAELAAFVEGTFTATKFVDRNYSVRQAAAMVRSIKQARSAGGCVYWELLADLSWLASGKSGERVSERTVRRYLEGQRKCESPVRAYWRRNGKLIVTAILRNPLQKTVSPNWVHTPKQGPPQFVGPKTKRQLKAIDAFTEIAKRYLEASDPPNSKAAKKRS